MKVIFYGSKNAGMVVLLTLKHYFNDIRVIAEDDIVAKISEILGLEQIDFKNIDKFDLFICCHGKRIISKEILDAGVCINLHPCLYKYKGAYPTRKLLEDGETKASVGCHFMTEKVDQGKVIYEEFVDVSDCKTEVEVYNKLYIHYASVLSSTIISLGYGKKIKGLKKELS